MEAVSRIARYIFDFFRNTFIETGKIISDPRAATKNPKQLLFTLLKLIIILNIVGFLTSLIVRSGSSKETYIAGDETSPSPDFTDWSGWTRVEGPKNFEGQLCGSGRKYRSRGCLRQPCGTKKDLDVEIIHGMPKCPLQIGP